MQVLNSTELLCSGADLWVVLKKHDCPIWQKINYYCLGLLEQNDLYLNPHMLLGASDHFFAKWILYFETSDINLVLAETDRICSGLKSNSARFMNFSGKQLAELQNLVLARPMTSLNSLSCVAPI